MGLILDTSKAEAVGLDDLDEEALLGPTGEKRRRRRRSPRSCCLGGSIVLFYGTF